MRTIDIYDKDRVELRDEAIFADKSALESLGVPWAADITREAAMENE